MAQPHLAAMAPRGKLKPREGVHRHCVWIDAAYVAEGDVRTAVGQNGTDTLAEPGQVGACDRAADGEGDRLRP